jgi:hypothetical protein
MALFEWGGPVIHSTGAGLTSNPASTGVVVATIDSTQLSVLTNGRTGSLTKGVMVRLTAALGGSSSFMWRIEQSVSSTITDPVVVSIPVFTPAYQTGQYVFSLDLQPNHLIRARGSDTGTGTFCAYLQVEPQG